MRKVFALALAAAALCLGGAAHPAVIPREVVPRVAHGDELVAAAATGAPVARGMSKEQQEAEVYCPTRDCTGGRDWLVQKPSAAAGWAVGSVAFLASGILVRFRDSFTTFAMVELGISLFLRAGLNYGGNKRSMYIASLYFNYSAATILFVSIFGGAFALKAIFDETKAGRALASSIVTILVNMALFAMVVAGVVIMYREETMLVKNVGWRIIQAVLYIMVILTGLSLLMLLKSAFGGSGAQTLASLALLVAAILIGLWSSFMLSRTYLPLSSVTRSSEVAFYLLNVAPLLIIGIIF